MSGLHAAVRCFPAPNVKSVHDVPLQLYQRGCVRMTMTYLPYPHKKTPYPHMLMTALCQKHKWTQHRIFQNSLILMFLAYDNIILNPECHLSVKIHRRQQHSSGYKGSLETGRLLVLFTQTEGRSHNNSSQRLLSISLSTWKAKKKKTLQKWQAYSNQVRHVGAGQQERFSAWPAKIPSKAEAAACCQEICDTNRPRCDALALFPVIFLFPCCDALGHNLGC